MDLPVSNVNPLLAVDLNDEKQLFLVDLVEIQSRGTPEGARPYMRGFGKCESKFSRSVRFVSTP